MHTQLNHVRRVGVAIAMSAAVAAGATACSSSGSPARSSSEPPTTAKVVGGVQQVTIHANDQLRFAPDTIDVHTGKVQVTLVSDGSYPHNISVPSLHVTSKTVSGNPGQTTTTLTLDLPKPGSYEFVCTFHSSAGMRGHLVVK
jgi:plastocyanin